MRQHHSNLFIYLFFLLFALGLIGAFIVNTSSISKDSSRASLTATIIHKISFAVDYFKTDVGRYPTTAEGLEILVQPNVVIKNYMPGGYLKKLPHDGWNQPFIYYFPAQYGNKVFDLYSLGENGRDEQGKGDDISNWSHDYLCTYNLSWCKNHTYALLKFLSPFIILSFLSFILSFKIESQKKLLRRIFYILIVFQIILLAFIYLSQSVS